MHSLRNNAIGRERIAWHRVWVGQAIVVVRGGQIKLLEKHPHNCPGDHVSLAVLHAALCNTRNREVLLAVKCLVPR